MDEGLLCGTFRLSNIPRADDPVLKNADITLLKYIQLSNRLSI